MDLSGCVRLRVGSFQSVGQGLEDYMVCAVNIENKDIS